MRVLKLISRLGGFSLTFRISIAITLLIIVLMAAVGVSTYIRDANILFDSVKSHGWITVNTVSAFAGSKMLKRDYSSLNEILRSMAEDDYIRQAMIVNAQGTVVAHSDPRGLRHLVKVDEVYETLKSDAPTMRPVKDRQGNVVSLALAAPIEDDGGNPIGYFYLLGDLEPVQRHLFQLGKNLLIYFLIGVLAALVITRWIIILAVGKPISEIIDVTQQIALGDFSHRLKARTRDEIGSLSYAFNVMSDRIGILFDLISSSVKEMAHASNIIDHRSREVQLDEEREIKESHKPVAMKEINANARHISRNIDKLLSLTKQFNTDIRAKGEGL